MAFPAQPVVPEGPRTPPNTAENIVMTNGTPDPGKSKDGNKLIMFVLTENVVT